MKKIFTLGFILMFVDGFGQMINEQIMKTLDVNNVGAQVPIGGNFFTNYDRAGFLCPRDDMNPGIAAIYWSSLWLSSFDAANNLKVSAVTYENRNPSNLLDESTTDFFDGPISDNYDAEFDSLYRTVWKVNKTEVEYHRLHYADAGYVIPASIANWRGNGRTAYGESQILAPFQDINNNGIYEPQLGDYPLIRGDQAIFKILNDDRNPHASGGQKLGVELKMMFYGYITNDVVNNAVYLHIEITNKSGGVLNDFKLSNFVDIDLGCFSNDRVGCDSALNLFFGYNGSLSDPMACVAGTKGFLEIPVSVGILSLCSNLTSFIPYSGYNSLTEQQYRDVQNCFDFQQNCYVYPGDVTDSTQWSELYPTHEAAGDRSVVGTYNLENFPIGATKVFDMAYFLTWDTFYTTNSLTVTNLMKQQSHTVKSHFLSNAPCGEVMSLNRSVGAGINDASLQLGISPNPSNGVFTLTSDIPQGGEISVYSITGAKVFTAKAASFNRAVIDISHQPKGIYIVKAANSKGVWTQRVVVE